MYKPISISHQPDASSPEVTMSFFPLSNHDSIMTHCTVSHNYCTWLCTWLFGEKDEGLSLFLELEGVYLIQIRGYKCLWTFYVMMVRSDIWLKTAAAC